MCINIPVRYDSNGHVMKTKTCCVRASWRCDISCVYCSRHMDIFGVIGIHISTWGAVTNTTVCEKAGSAGDSVWRQGKLSLTYSLPSKARRIYQGSVGGTSCKTLRSFCVGCSRAITTEEYDVLWKAQGRAITQ